MADDQETTLDAVGHKRSVKKTDFSYDTAIPFMFPTYGTDGYLKRYPVLPRTLPGYNREAFFSNRDLTLLSTPRHEAVWANTVAIATSKAAAWGWEVESDIPLRRKRLQELLMVSTMGALVGWVPFIAAHLRSYLLTGRAVVEIERQTGAPGSKITAIHHLNPLRCRITDNPLVPVEYMDRRGVVHQLKFWQVIVLVDNPDPTEGDNGYSESAAERIYHRIATFEAVHTYLYEKLTGTRPLSLEFIQGITSRVLENALSSAESQVASSGNLQYQGVVAIPIVGDVPVTRVTIPLAEVPDGFAYQEIHDNILIDYAAATGMDVNDLDPRLAQRAGLGAGAQAVVLHEKTKGKGLAAWRLDWMQNIHRLVADLSTKFSWSEESLDDESKRAQNSKTREERRKMLLEMKIVSPEQARELAVEDGDLPREFLDTPIPKEEAPPEGAPGGPPGGAPGGAPPAPGAAPTPPVEYDIGKEVPEKTGNDEQADSASAAETGKAPEKTEEDDPATTKSKEADEALALIEAEFEAARKIVKRKGQAKSGGA